MSDPLDPHGIQCKADSLDGNISAAMALQQVKVRIITADVIAVRITNHVPQGAPVLDHDPLFLVCRAVHGNVRAVIDAREILIVVCNMGIRCQILQGRRHQGAVRQTLGAGLGFPNLNGIGEDLAGYKGYGYATIVEILSAALQQGNYLKMLTGIGEGGKKVPYHLGHFFIAIDTNAFMGADEFKKTCGDILRELRNSTKAPGQDRIFTAGEKEWDIWCERKDSGVPINEARGQNLYSL